MTSIRRLASISVDASAAGFGLSGGRSLYRSIEKNVGAILIVSLLIAGSGVAAFLLRRGSNRGWFGTIFVLFLPCFLLLMVSVGFAVIIGIGFGKHSAVVLEWLLGWQVLTFVAGILVAGRYRRQRKLKHNIETANTRFLEQIGFRDVGGRNQTWLDKDGRELVLQDMRLDALVFRIKNQRGKRSRIDLDPNGRMVGYVPG